MDSNTIPAADGGSTTTTYKLNVTCEGFSVGYTMSPSGLTGTLYDGVPKTFDFGTTQGYITLNSPTLSTGYSHPIKGSSTTGTTSWTVTNSDGSLTSAGKTVNAYSGGGVRYVTLSATEKPTTYTYYARLKLSAPNGKYPSSSSDTIDWPTYGSSSASSTNSGTNVNITLPTSTQTSYIPVRDGYKFLGYANSSGATSAAYDSGDPVVVYSTSTYSSSPAVKTVYAVWEKDPVTYYGKLNLNANGGSFSTSTTGTLTWPTSGFATAQSTGSSANVTITLPTDSTYIPTKSGYKFLGWSGSSNSTSVDYTSGGKVTFAATSTSYNSPTTQTLYAVWEKLAVTYYGRLKLNGNGGKFSGDRDEINWYDTATGASSTGSSAKVSITLPTSTQSSGTPIRAGYTLKGWSTSPTATTANYSIGGTVQVTAESTYQSSPTELPLYAVWEKNEDTYYARLILSAPNGTYAYSSSDTLDWPLDAASYAKSTESGININIALPTSSQTRCIPDRNGYKFLGYAASSNAAHPAYYNGENVTVYATSTNANSPTTKTIFAIWEQEKYTLTYTTSYDGVTDMPESKTGLTYGMGITTTSVIPKLEGYDFKGWSTTDGGDVRYTAGVNIYITGDVTLYTVFEKKPEYTYYAKLKLSAPNGKFPSSSSDTVDWPDSYNIPSATSTESGTNVNITLPTSADTSYIPVRSGYQFLGYAHSSNATSPAYNSGDPVVVYSTSTYRESPAVKTLYAVWEDKEYTIQIQADESIRSFEYTYIKEGKEQSYTSSKPTASIEADPGTKVVLSVIPNDGYDYPVIVTSYTNALLTTVDGTWSLSNDNTIDVNRNRYITLSATAGERTYYYRVDYVCDGELVGSSPVMSVIGADDSGYTVYVDELPPLDYYDNTGEYEAGAYCTFDGVAFTIQPFSSGETTYEDPAVFIAYVSKSLYTLRLHFMLTTNVELNYFEEYDIPAETYISAYDYCDLYNPDPNLYTYAYAKDVNGSIVDGVTIMGDTDLYLYYTGEYYYAQLELDPNGGHWEDGYTGSAYYPDYQESEYQIIDIIVPDYEPLRDGYVFKGWIIDGSEYVYTAGNVVSVTSMSFDASMPTVQKLSAYWVPKIQHFYWSGSDESDAQLIAPGKSQGNLTAERWNSLLAMMSELAISCGAPFSYAPVSGRINAVLFNNAVVELTNISNALGVSVQIPVLQSKDGIMYASTLNGPQSIKGAINELIDVYNEG